LAPIALKKSGIEIDAFALDQFLVFSTVADRGSFARAAKRLGCAQSAVTYAIGRLEAEVGAPLFDRGARSAS
jgi:DNA-binding transcriptional LysR family regulator